MNSGTHGALPGVLTMSMETSRFRRPPAFGVIDHARARMHARPIHCPPRVMVADDDLEMRRIVVEAIRKDGYDVREASDGSGLLVNLTERYTRRREDVTAHDLVISDTRMPLWTSLDILAGLRQKQWTVPVILMTAFGDDETRRRAEGLGAILFDKPFAIDALRAVVTTLMPLHKREGASEARDLEPLDPEIT